jgi:light-regulated signal transduction histidine kinase (bacteriophytochrome)
MRPGTRILLVEYDRSSIGFIEPEHLRYLGRRWTRPGSRSARLGARGTPCEGSVEGPCRIARQTADAHEGIIEVSSKPGEDSTFTLLLPKKTSDPRKQNF